MFTLEIKVNDRIVERVEVLQVEPDVLDSERDKWEKGYDEGLRMYLVDGVFKIMHRRQDGHRELARKALDVIKAFKK